MDLVVPYRGTVSWQRFKDAQWKHLGRGWLTLLLFPVAMTSYAFLTIETLSDAMWVFVLVVSFCWVPFMLALILRGWRRTYAKSPYLHKPLVGSVSSETFIAEGVTGRTEMRWDQFVRIRHGKDFLLLYHSPQLFNVLAREFFESDAAWETARGFAARVAASRVGR